MRRLCTTLSSLLSSLSCFLARTSFILGVIFGFGLTIGRPNGLFTPQDLTTFKRGNGSAHKAEEGEEEDEEEYDSVEVRGGDGDRLPKGSM